MAETTRKPPPKQARAAAKRDAILDATEALLGHSTPAEITTRAVARAANVPVGSIYRYFSNADDLLRALFSRMNAGTIGLLEDSLSREPFNWRDHVNDMFDHLRQMHASHPAYGALQAYLERGQDDDEITHLLQALFEREAPHLGSGLIRNIILTVTAMIDGVERRLPHLPEAHKDTALEQVRIAVTAYLSHHLSQQS